jgi:hypothetical protein
MMTNPIEHVKSLLNDERLIDIIIKPISPSGHSGRIYLPPQYVGLRATVLIEDVRDFCTHCNGFGSCRCASCAEKSGRTLTRRPVVIPVKCGVCKGSGKLVERTRERKHRRKPTSYQKPKKQRHRHSFKPDSDGVKRCSCGKTKLPKKKGKDTKEKVRNTARTQKRMPPPPRGH